MQDGLVSRSTHLAAQAGLSPGGLIVLVLAVMAASHLLLRWWVHRRARRDEAAAAGLATDSGRVRRWLARGLKEVLPPLALLVWIQGLAIIAGVLLQKMTARNVADSTSDALGWAYRLAMVAALCWLLARVGRLVETLLISLSTRAETSWDDLLLPLAGKAIRRALPLLALILAAPALSASPPLAEFVRNATSLLLIGVVALIMLEAVNSAAAFVIGQQRIDVADNLKARAIVTQIVVLKKLAVTVIGIFTVASMLMVFESVRQFGASILASAGIAGIVVGFAAQRSIATLLAGFQIALTQPIRVDDAVIVDGEWGRVEDITLTYVVVRIWDLRRLIVPITYFIEQPFQNWTRTSAELLAPVYFHVDYTVPVDALRAELSRILEASPLWDRKVNVLQVTDATERTLQVRALASAADGSNAWDLRCEIREKLIALVRERYPESLPRVRASLDRPDAGDAGGTLTARSGAAGIEG